MKSCAPCSDIFPQIYQYVAEWLTGLELHRTQTEHDDALSLKIYLLQFVNYYASILYIAFAKGNFVGYPGNYNRLLGGLSDIQGSAKQLRPGCVNAAGKVRQM